MDTNHNIQREEAEVMAAEPWWTRRKIKGSVLIQRTSNNMNLEKGLQLDNIWHPLVKEKSSFSLYGITCVYLCKERLYIVNTFTCELWTPVLLAMLHHLHTHYNLLGYINSLASFHVSFYNWRRSSDQNVSQQKLSLCYGKRLNSQLISDWM